MKSSIAGILMAGSVAASAQTPTLYFQALTQTDISIASDEVKRVIYKVRNQSTKPHSIKMREIVGVTQVPGTATCIDKGRLEAGQSCILNLEIDGSKFIGLEDVSPRVCVDSSATACFTPSDGQALRITKV